MRTMQQGFASLRAEMNAGFTVTEIRFEQVNEKFEQVNEKFEQVNHKIENLDRDVQTLFRKVFPEYPEAG